MFFYLFVCFWHFAALYLRAASVDRRETFRHDWKCVNLDNVGTKIGATAFFALRLQISELPRPIAVKLCQMTENMSSFKSWSKNVGVPEEKNVGEAKIQNWAQNLAY